MLYFTWESECLSGHDQCIVLRFVLLSDNALGRYVF